jgi:hypothetical protein
MAEQGLKFGDVYKMGKEVGSLASGLCRGKGASAVTDEQTNHPVGGGAGTNDPPHARIILPFFSLTPFPMNAETKQKQKNTTWW